MNMKTVPISEIIAKARHLTSEKKRWHFHVLGTDCVFNECKGRFRIVFEDERSKEALASVFEQKPLEQAKALADLLYGKGFLHKEGTEDKQNPDFNMILSRAKELTEKGLEWHHHHLPPNCIFSTDKGRHSLVLEDPVTKKTLKAVYDHDPIEDLAKIERLFFRELDTARS